MVVDKGRSLRAALDCVTRKEFRVAGARERGSSTHRGGGSKGEENAEVADNRVKLDKRRGTARESTINSVTVSVTLSSVSLPQT